MDWEPVIDWLLEHGTKIAIILVIAIVVYYVMRRTVRAMV